MIRLKNRGVLLLQGEDVVNFLDNMLTNNVDKATTDTAVFAGLLSPQGKYLFDMFVIKKDDGIILDCSFPQELAKRLKMYKLRLNVTIQDISNEYGVYSETKANPEGQYFCHFKDDRALNMGYRIIAPINEISEDDDFNKYEIMRINAQVPELQSDLLRDGDFALEGLMDEMGAIDFHKGCYVGQEMTSRMKRRTTVRNKLRKFEAIGAPPPYNSPISADGITIGYSRSTAILPNDNKYIGMALIRIDKTEVAIAAGQKILVNGNEIFIPNAK